MGKTVYFEVKNGSTASANLQSLVKFTMPAPSPIRLIELSILPDSAFTSYGDMQLVVGGQTQSTTAQPLLNTMTIPFWTFKAKTKLPDGTEIDGIVLLPNEEIEIKGNSDGTNTVLLSCSLLGEVL